MAESACKPGEDYRDGIFYRLPCDSIQWHLSLLDEVGTTPTQRARVELLLAQKGVCDQFTEPDNCEIEAHQRLITQSIERMKSATAMIRSIKLEHAEENWNGSVKCPICNGVLRVTHAAYNGHVHGRCETLGCLAWIE